MPKVIENTVKAKGGNLAGDAAARFTAIFAAKSLALISVPVIARALGPSTYGTFALITIFVQYAVVPVEFGFRAYGIREAAKPAVDARVLLGDLISARLTIAIACYIAALGVGLAFFESVPNPVIIPIALISVFAAGLDIDFYFFGRRRFVLPSVMEIVLQIMYVIAVLTWVNEPSDLIVLIAISAVQPFVNSVALLAAASADIPRPRISATHAVRLFRKVMLLGLGAKASLVFTTLPVAILGAVASRAEVGLFASFMKVFGIVSLAMQTSLQVLAPRIVRLTTQTVERRARAARNLALVSVAGSLVAAVTLFMVAGPVVRLLFGPEFLGAAAIMRLAAVSVVPVWILYLLAVGWLNNFGEDRAYVHGSGVLVAALAVFTITLVPRLHAEGAVIAMAAALLTTVLFYSRHIVRTAREA